MIAEETVIRKTIDILDQQATLARTLLEKSKDTLNLAQANLDYSDKNYQRTYRLAKDNYNSQKLLDDASLSLAEAQSGRNQALLGIQMNEQTLILIGFSKNAAEQKLASVIQARERAERDLKKTKILAPIDGILSNSALRVGNYVRSGTPLFSTVPKNLKYLRVNFKENQITKLKPGMKVEIVFDSLPNKTFHGKIRNIAPATGSKFSLFPPDNATGNFTKIVQRVPILVDFACEEEDERRLVPGMSATAYVRTDR
jgi:membrane fusion protein (multidrug efflux system)